VSVVARVYDSGGITEHTDTVQIATLVASLNLAGFEMKPHGSVRDRVQMRNEAAGVDITLSLLKNEDA
jgi:hypothetical protein